MIKSMTGFGQASLNKDELNLVVEVKSLNSKFFDLSLRLPRLFAEKELEVRNMVSDKLERGKITLNIDLQQAGKAEVRQQYNEALFVAYYTELKKLADKTMASYDGLFELALNSPDVIVGGGKEELSPALWESLQKLIAEALVKCEQFRVTEGKALEEKLVLYIKAIEAGLTRTEELDPQRIERVRARIKGNLKEFLGNEGIDMNRLEQELIFYIEKLDIHEERVRLSTHLNYFLKLLVEPQSNGKKLGFLAQEIGREINTIGSKANDAEMQRSVVMMKEELEKIKEQLGNVL
ncbi:MAG TPA: YicC/YloC family endoribonuclease [Cyclobacteriaceae bacterium]|nr:YicC/YloC family endoribonuclease [Cyclobacteriaceae bacterium]